MTNNDVLTLAKAGFTATQIAALNSVQGNSKTDQEAANAQNQMAGVSDDISKLTNMLQAQALANFAQPKTETTDEILASIIAPPEQNGGANK